VSTTQGSVLNRWRDREIICRVNSSVLDVVITPSKEDRVFWLLWSSAGVVILAIACHEFAEFRLRALPNLVMLSVFSAIVLAKGLSSWVWYAHGRERVRITDGHFFYQRYGSCLDRKERTVNLTNVKQCIVLQFGVGDNLEPNRLQLKTHSGSLYLGRNLTKPQGEQIRTLLNRFVSNLE
jgi:hypothetical protein